MATTRVNSRLDIILDACRTFFQQKSDQMRNSMVKRKIYRATYAELSTLSDRDLRDLGIARSNIKRLAMEAAYDC
ncbi:MAG: DUF1127 domain-containing protein [Sulfitobacter sp.]